MSASVAEVRTVPSEAAARAGAGADLIERLGVVAILAGALALRLWHLGARSLWTDEGSTWTAASSPLRELIRLCAEKDASPPLFYLLTSASLHLFGTSEAALRLVSALASTVMVWLAYRITRLFETRRVAMLVALVAALGPYSLMYAQEARTYTLVAMFATASLYAFLRAAVLGVRRAWIPYVIVTTLGLYTQVLVVLGLGVQGAVLLSMPQARRRLGAWLLAIGVCVLLYVPWLFISLRQMAHLGSSHWYMAPPGIHAIVQVLRGVFVAPLSLVAVPAGSPVPGVGAFVPMRVGEALVLLVAGLPFAAAAWGIRRGTPRGVLALVAWTGVLIPLLGVLAVSHVKPLWNLRYFVLVTPLQAVLVGVGLASLTPRALRVTWTVLVLALLAYACVRYDVDVTKEPWRSVGRTIEREQLPHRTAVLVTYDADPFRFYASRMATRPAVFEVSHPQVPFNDAWTPAQLSAIEAAARAHTRAYDDVWVIVRSPISATRWDVAHRAQHIAAEGRTLVEQGTWTSTGGPLVVSRYRREPTARP